jgi:hypothetical protein
VPSRAQPRLVVFALFSSILVAAILPPETLGPRRWPACALLVALRRIGDRAHERARFPARLPPRYVAALPPRGAPPVDSGVAPRMFVVSSRSHVLRRSRRGSQFRRARRPALHRTPLPKRLARDASRSPGPRSETDRGRISEASRGASAVLARPQPPESEGERARTRLRSPPSRAGPGVRRVSPTPAAAADSLFWA